MIEQRRIITARYSGRCPICDLGTQIGERLIEYGGHWAHERCYLKLQRALDTLLELERIMRERHHIALGVWGIPAGCKHTHTRRQFLELARAFGELGHEDEQLLLWHWRGILDHDLSD